MQRLNDVFKEINTLEHAKTILEWDSSVNIPIGGLEARTESIKEITLSIYKKLNDSKIGHLFLEIEDSLDSRPDQEHAHFKEMKRVYEKKTSIPKELVIAQVCAKSNCVNLWRRLHEKNDWKGILPAFLEVVNLAKEEAAIRGEKTNLSKYEALFQLYEPSYSIDDIDNLVLDLQEFLPSFLKDIIDKQTNLDVENISESFSIKDQKDFSMFIMKQLGFDFNKGRLDFASNMFCSRSIGDTRIVSNCSQHNIIENLMNIIHQTGHALYKQNLPSNWEMFPVGMTRGPAFNESQSLIYEKHIAMSPAFIDYLSPLLKSNFDKNIENKNFLTSKNLLKYVSSINKSIFRVNADEITYSLHIIIRYQIEKRLIEGRLDPKDLPEAWNLSMQNFFDIDTKHNFKDGCMQDIYWYAGRFGYFPTYLLGSVMASQIFNTLQAKNKKLEEEISIGNFKNINNFLHENIWKNASFYSTKELIKKVCDEPLSTKYLKKHLSDRYLA